MAMKLPTLYKLKKKLLVWEIETFHPPLYNKPVYKITFGQKGGKMQETITEVSSGKNIGKANETTPEEQCDLEAQALWQRQIDRKGYGITANVSSNEETISDVLAWQHRNLPSPMLALEYNKFAHKVKFPCHISKKYDGIRCLAYLDDIAENKLYKEKHVILLSRQRKTFNNLYHIKKELFPILQANPRLVFDGELYSHKYTFQEIISAVKRDDPNNLTAEVEYHTYDLITQGGFKHRFALLSSLVKNLKYIKLVDAPLINSANDIEPFHQKWIAEGYEGVMIRNSDGLYKQDGRSQDLLKYKKFIDREFPIVGAEQNKGKLSNTCTFQLRHNNTIFSAMPEGSLEEREQLYEDWKNGTIKKGDLATVKFFSWTTGHNPVPRFPIMKGVRSYE